MLVELLPQEVQLQLLVQVLVQAPELPQVLEQTLPLLHLGSTA
jgi:hypothetical protein